MRIFSKISALLFGLAFAGSGFLFLAEMALPSWDSWQRMQDWRPSQAALISVSGGDNETRAQYRYQYNGVSYQGNRVGVSETKDNIGSYHKDMRSYLRRIKRNNELLPIWVNPANPSEAVIDREMRWGLFAFMSGFCSIFILIGLVVAYVGLTRSNRKLTQEDADATTPIDWQSRKGWETAQIRSDAGKGTIVFWVFALIWYGISFPVLWAIPEELEKENYLALIVILFPLVGLGLIYKAVQPILEFKRFGRVLLQMDPYPGAIGGHVGGHLQVKKLDYRIASQAEALTITLECVHSYVSGSGKNRSRNESIKWAERGTPGINKSYEGVTVTFRFNVPEALPPADVEQSNDYYFWRLKLAAEIPGIDLNRSYNIPVFATGEASRNVSHDISAQAAAIRQQESEAAALAIASGKFDIDGLSRAMRLQQEGNRIEMQFPMFRNKILSLFAAVFSGGFGFACYQMWNQIADGGWFEIFIAILSIPFFLVALVATIATIYLLFNSLRVRIMLGEISVLRRLFCIPIYSRTLRRDEISHLSIKRGGSTGQGVDKVEHYKIYAHDKGGGKVTLAEDINGEDVASHFRDYLAQRIGA